LDNIKLNTAKKASKKVKPSNLTKSAVGHDIQNSYIQKLYMRSGAFTLYLLTGILGYAQKIPV